MAKPRIPNQKQKYQELNKRLMKYVTLVEQIYDTLNLEAAKVAARTSYDGEGEKPFKFSDYPQTKDAIAKLQAQFVDDISAVIYTGTSEEWKESNLVQDLVADKVLKAYGAEVNGKKYEVFYQTNSDALKAFQQRKDKGLNISDKLWNQSRVYKDELEAAISCAIEKGTGAVTLSKQISKYLLDFPSLQKDYKQKYGKAANIYDCEYRSIRLARSEINMAYRTAEQTRWQQFDFVVGYEIKLSNNHNCKGVPAGQFYDICDELAGKYPKTFKWSSWHPSCRCYEIPILKTEEEFWAWDEEKGNDTGSVNEVKDVPDNFKQWAGTNSQRIANATKRGTLPYFVKDNKELVDDILTGNPVKDYYMPTNTNTDTRKLWVDNAVAIERKLGITQGNPMTFDEANELRGNINFVPKYIVGKNGRLTENPSYTDSDKKYSVNCQSCVVANELRRRGFDVTALPNLETKGNIPYELSLKTEWAWIDPVTGAMPKKGNIGNTVDKRGRIIAKPYKEAMSDLKGATKESGRYHINFTWKDGGVGHIITFERMDNGKIKWYDPQTGKTDFFDKAYYERIKASRGIKVLRVDNLLLNTEIIDGVVEQLKK